MRRSCFLLVVLLLVACAATDEEPRPAPAGDAPRQERSDGDDVREAVAAGRLPREHVALAAYLGDARALASGVPAWQPPAADDRRAPLQQVLVHGGLDRPTLVRISVELSGHLLPRFEAAHPDDDRPRRALQAALAWAGGAGTLEACRETGLAASDAGEEEYGFGPEDVRTACEIVSYPCAVATNDGPGAVAAEGAWYAAEAVAGEGDWQLARVRELLLTPPPWPDGLSPREPNRP